MTDKATVGASAHKQPVSVLVLIYRPDGQILLMERADHFGFWQSVTGSLEAGETPLQAARREVVEETGLRIEPPDLHDWHHSSVYEIYPHWRHRYAPGVCYNTEHVFSARAPARCTVQLAATEHRTWGWYTLAEAAVKVFSPSNRDALLALPQHWVLTNNHDS